MDVKTLILEVKKITLGAGGGTVGNIDMVIAKAELDKNITLEKLVKNLDAVVSHDGTVGDSVQTLIDSIKIDKKPKAPKVPAKAKAPAKK